MQFDENDQIEYLPNSIKHKSAGGFVFFENKQTHELFVALLRTTNNYYVIPKGHIKKNEQPELAAIREIKEELSLKETPKIISFLGISNYKFTFNNNNITHFKNVHLYALQLDEKSIIQPKVDEGLESAEWIKLEEAIKKISFDKENLLKARQVFYYNKQVKTYESLLDIPSITIAMATYNGSKTIKNTLYSIVKRLEELPRSMEKEVIICTDHCSDCTKMIVENFIKNNEDKQINFKLIENTSLKGKAIVLDKIFTHSSGEIFCIIDDDVILAEKCLAYLLEALATNSNLRCAFSAWQRLPLKSKNPWKLFWHWIFCIKFDIQPYNKPSELMSGACMMMRKENFVNLPPVLNEDQFLQYIYWPETQEIKNSILYFNSVSNFSDYYHRFVRIMVGSKQMSQYFTKERVYECYSALSRKINYQKIMSLPWKLKTPFLFYNFIRFFLISYIKIKLNFIKDYEWFRFKQN